jgi:hypothetical protein
VLEKAFGLSEKAVEHIKSKFASWKHSRTHGN